MRLIWKLVFHRYLNELHMQTRYLSYNTIVTIRDMATIKTKIYIFLKVIGHKIHFILWHPYRRWFCDSLTNQRVKKMKKKIIILRFKDQKQNKMYNFVIKCFNRYVVLIWHVWHFKPAIFLNINAGQLRNIVVNYLIISGLSFLSMCEAHEKKRIARCTMLLVTGSQSWNYWNPLLKRNCPYICIYIYITRKIRNHGNGLVVIIGIYIHFWVLE